MLRFIYCHAERYSAECRYAERRILFIVMLNVIMLKVIMLNVIILKVIMLNVFMLNVFMLYVFMPSVMASCMHAPMACFQNAAAYFATVVSYPRKMFVKWTPGPNIIKLFCP